MDVDVGQPAVQRVGPGKLRRGQRRVGAELPGKPRQQVGAADVGHEPDADLGHGNLEPLCDHASSTAAIAGTITWLSALIALGRLSVMRPRPSCTLIKTSSIALPSAP